MKESLKASSLMGMSSIVTIITGIIKQKVVAILLGPSGIGLIGMLVSFQNTASMIAGMGVSNSGIRQIAEATSSDNHENVGNVYRSMLILTIFFGVIGAVAVFSLDTEILRILGVSLDHKNSIRWISLGIFASILSGTQVALLNGLRRLKDLAKINIVGASSSMIVTVAAIWLYADKGLVTVVVSLPVCNLIISWWLVRALKQNLLGLNNKNLKEPVRKLVSLGFVFMSTAVLSIANQLLIRILITHQLGTEAAGNFQAAWSISMLYLGFVLNAMGTDYFPKLTVAIHDNAEANRMVNEQAHIALLLSGPIILGMLTFVSEFVWLLYSSEFNTTVDILRWQFLGDILKVASWPLGFILMALGASRLYFCTELTWNMCYLLVVWGGIAKWGLTSTGIAFFIAYFIIGVLIYIIVNNLTGFKLQKYNLYLILVLFAFAVIINIIGEYSHIASILIGSLFTILMATFSYRRISESIGGVSWRRIIRDR